DPRAPPSDVSRRIEEHERTARRRQERPERHAKRRNRAHRVLQYTPATADRNADAASCGDRRSAARARTYALGRCARRHASQMRGGAVTQKRLVAIAAPVSVPFRRRARSAWLSLQARAL